jgi:membrane protein
VFIFNEILVFHQDSRGKDFILLTSPPESSINLGHKPVSILQIIRSWAGFLKQAFTEFNRNEPLRLAGATSFFATFALPAILIILIQVFGLLIDPQTISRHLFENLAEIIGRNTVEQLRLTLKNVRALARSWWIAAGGFLFLIFVSTTLFKVIKDSLNQIWGIKMKEQAGVGIRLLHRVRSFLAILLTGLLFITALLAEGTISILHQYIRESVPDNAFWLNGVLNQGLSLLLVSAWFTMMFKFLPDGRPAWKVAMTGAIFTGILFTFGKLLLRWMLSYSNMHNIYGASTSMVLLLLFIFYSSFIFYYGACFTKVWAGHKRQEIQAGKNALKYRILSEK